MILVLTFLLNYTFFLILSFSSATVVRYAVRRASIAFHWVCWCILMIHRRLFCFIINISDFFRVSSEYLYCRHATKKLHIAFWRVPTFPLNWQEAWFFVIFSFNFVRFKSESSYVMSIKLWNLYEYIHHSFIPGISTFTCDPLLWNAFTTSTRDMVFHEQLRLFHQQLRLLIVIIMEYIHHLFHIIIINVIGILLA